MEEMDSGQTKREAEMRRRRRTEGWKMDRDAGVRADREGEREGEREGGRERGRERLRVGER